MSAGTQQSAIDALREDEDVIVIEKSCWFKNLHTTIHHAVMRKTFEDYLYDPLMEILGTYVKTYNHEDLQASIIPQGCFELRTDASTTVSRRLSDLLVIIHTVNLGDPQYSKSRLGGWLEAKPWTQAPKSKKKEAANAGTKLDTGQADSAGQDKRQGKGITTEANEVKNVTDEVGEQLKDNTVETDTELEDINEVVEVDITEEEVRAGEGPTMLVGGPSIEDASALVLDSQEAYFAFHHFSEDVIHVLLTYEMTLSCFKFIRPANWDSIRDNKEGTVDAPTVIFSNEHMVFPEQINPHLLQAFQLMTASLGLSYQPSWFDPPAHDIVKPDLSVANAALTQYRTKLRGDLASPETTTVSSKSGSSNYSPTASEAAAPVGESKHDLQSGKGHLTMSAPNLEPVAENEGIETHEPALEQ
ncbi:hypothetical protein EWM64_g6839 [Hericium alpestre]|uniref:Uncharacterized protein n=1 Tax=Hericium alpestre TaxID=135208 RepID=A0A4Y9ZRG2_9AGAM|nr:hypothetical protein EWM64_g6839 [Hericium alpestre]